MGYTSYSSDDRSTRSFISDDGTSYKSRTDYFKSASTDAVFTQQKEGKIHPDMNPNKVNLRVCADSTNHPLTVPIQLYLDVTGSMLNIPKELIKDGLPTLMSTLIQNGVKDASLMFGAIGDHECDTAPLQVGQFESGDAELDLWLTRTWLEGHGGGNAGESYHLAWYFAGYHVQHDAWDKRQTKGFVFTIGDEPCLRNLPANAIKSIMGEWSTGQGNFTIENLLAEAQKTNHIFHIFLEHGSRRVDGAWKRLLGQNLIVLNDHNLVAKTVADIVLANSSVNIVTTATTTNNDIIL